MPNRRHTYILNIHFFLPLNYCTLFNAKSSLYTYIKYIRFGLVWFYGKLAIVGYLMPNHLLYI